jgi:hypothetical protein
MLEHVLRKAEEIANRVGPKSGFHTEVLRTLGTLLFTIKNSAHAAEHEWRVQVDHNDTRYRPGNRPDGGCCRELPICTPETVVELLLGPECPMSVPEAKELLATHGYVKAKVRLISMAELR